MTLLDPARPEDRPSLEAIARAAITPDLPESAADPVTLARKDNGLSRYIFSGFAFFVISFITLETLIPNTVLGEVLTFMMFPVLFIACMAAALWLARHKIAALILRSQRAFIARAKAWLAIANATGVTYVPAPGGAPEGLRWLAKQKWASAHLGPLAQMLDDHDGMDAAVAAAREAGIFLRNMSVLGKPDEKAKLVQQLNQNQSTEDGFEGSRGGVRFSLFEWGEDQDDAPDIYHLVLVLTAPTRLQGVTQVRTRKGRWPLVADEKPLAGIDLGARTFSQRFDVRGQDQVEARALLNPAVMERLLAVPEAEEIVIVAKGAHVVIDIAADAGRNRFNLVDIRAAVWNDETIKTGVADFGEALNLVDAFAHALMVRA